MPNDNSLYNADELVAPDWLNVAFFEEILTKKLSGQTVKVQKLTITPGTTKSDHYASVMFRAKIEYTLQSSDVVKLQSLIIKTAPFMEGEKKEMLEQFSVFETEIRMYTESLPKIEAVLKEHGDSSKKLYANIFYYSLKPHKCIIFEDLVELGYATISQRFCSMEEAKAALLKLAKVHAVSFKLAQEGDSSITSYVEGSFSDEKIKDMKFMCESLPIFKKCLEKHEDLRTYLPSIEKIEGDILERIIVSFNAYRNGKRDGIFVLNHGDFHVKNMMIKEQHGKLVDLMLVDFQMCVFASPAIDLIYAFVMLFSPEMRLKHRDELFYYYFTNFQKVLLTTGFKGRIPTLIDFQKELLDHAHWEIFLATSFLAIGYTMKDPTADVAKFVEDYEYRSMLSQRDEVINEMRILLPFYLHRGYLEI